MGTKIEQLVDMVLLLNDYYADDCNMLNEHMDIFCRFLGLIEICIADIKQTIDKQY